MAMVILQPGDDLQEALDAAAPGMALRLAPGEYRLAAPLRFRQGLLLVGAGAGRTRLTRCRAPHAHLAAAHLPAGDTLTLEGLTLAWADDDAHRPGVYLFQSDGLVVAGGRVALHGCRLAGSEAEHRRSGDDMYGGAGLHVFGDAEVRADGCEIEGHGGHGVLAEGRAAVALANGWVAGNRGMGLLAQGEATIDARETTFFENTRGGIAAFDAAALALAEATIQANGRFGVRLDSSRDARLVGCTIEANGGPGIAVDAGRLGITGGAVRRNAGDGVAIAAGQHGALTDLVVEENRGFGIAMGLAADVGLVGVAIMGNLRGDIDRGGHPA